MSAWRGSSGSRSRQQQLAVPQNHGQQIVEVVRHAAGQPSDGFHLLRLLILLLQRAAFGDVQGNADAAHRFAVLAEEDAARAAQPPHRAVGPDRSVLHREIGAGLHGLRQSSRARTPDRRDECARRTPRRSRQTFRAAGRTGLRGSRTIGARRWRSPCPRSRRSALSQRKPHALFRRSQRLDGLIPLGDVGAGTERADDAARVIPQHACCAIRSAVPRPTW